MKRVVKSEEQWRALLSQEQFHVCRLKGTEPAFRGEYHNCKTAGVYHCACCNTPLFLSTDKFDSGTGWPSFTRALNPECVAATQDHSHGMVRTEVHCAACDAHLGHLFSDGPAPAGLRYCINSVSLALVAEKQG